MCLNPSDFFGHQDICQICCKSLEGEAAGGRDESLAPYKVKSANSKLFKYSVNSNLHTWVHSIAYWLFIDLHNCYFPYSLLLLAVLLSPLHANTPICNYHHHIIRHKADSTVFIPRIVLFLCVWQLLLLLLLSWTQSSSLLIKRGQRLGFITYSLKKWFEEKLRDWTTYSRQRQK